MLYLAIKVIYFIIEWNNAMILPFYGDCFADKGSVMRGF